MTDEELQEIERSEREHWEQHGWERQRDHYIARVKGQVTGLITRRNQMWELANRLVETIEVIHSEAFADKKIDEREHLTPGRLASAVNDKLNASYGRVAMSRLLYRDRDSIIDLAVMECRTLMTARALSAKFDGETLDEVEARYISIIGDIIALWRRIQNKPPLGDGERRSTALLEAQSAAIRQRSAKPVTMAARERFWRDREQPVRKIFERKDRSDQ